MMMVVIITAREARLQLLRDKFGARMSFSQNVNGANGVLVLVVVVVVVVGVSLFVVDWFLHKIETGLELGPIL